MVSIADLDTIDLLIFQHIRSAYYLLYREYETEMVTRCWDLGGFTRERTAVADSSNSALYVGNRKAWHVHIQ
jgi:hypothetical protein